MRASFTYLPLVCVDKILCPLSAAKEKHGFADCLTIACLLSTFLNETAEWSNTSTVVLVSRTVDCILQSMRVRVRVAMLLLLKSQQVVGSNTLQHVRSSWNLDGFHNSGDRDLVLLHQGRRRNRVVTRLDLVEAFNDDGKRYLVPLLALRQKFEKLSEVVVTRGDLVMEVVLVVANPCHLGSDIVIG
jgi:hypothetical protein